MTVSIDSTTKKYHGRKAETYEEIRVKQERWDIENAEVKRMLKTIRPKSVLDVPCGTGRFIRTYDTLGVKDVTAIDVSDSMLALAKKKMSRVKSTMYVDFVCRDVREMTDLRVDVSVCVRFLDLIDDVAMRSVLKTLFRCTDRAILCTIRLGESYIPKSNTATHDKARFLRTVTKAGWQVQEDFPIFNQGWSLLHLVKA
jgi:2-polyprenyl-3-methyl-5-hydroxy-6-metoxy-1,4-benzoquinol methylase